MFLGLIFAAVFGLISSIYLFPRALDALKERRARNYDEYVRYCIKNNIRYY